MAKASLRVGRGAIFAIAIAAWALPALGCSGKRGGKRARDAAPALAVRLARPAARTPPPVAAPATKIGRGPKAVHPRRVPLALADGVQALDPPMRVRKILAVPDRPLAVASGNSAAGPALQLVDMDNGLIRWVDTSCANPAVHVTRDRVVCGGVRGFDGIDLDRGKSLWSAKLVYRAAHRRYAFGREIDDKGSGRVIDVQSGEVVARALAPEGETFADVVRICFDDEGFDLYALSSTAKMRRFRLPRTGVAAVRAELSWTRQLPNMPTKMDLCDAVMLIELPGSGARLYALLPVFARSGRDAGPALEVRGWWSAWNDKGIETATDAGVQLRARDLAVKRRITAANIGGRLVAEWGDLRLVRSVAGTLLLFDHAESLVWLAAPTHVRRAALTSTRLLAGARLGHMPQTASDHLVLFDLPTMPESPGGFRGAPLEAPRSADASAHVPQPLPHPSATAPARAIELASAGKHAVTHVAVNGQRLYAVTLEETPGPLRGAGIAAFDLESREWLWHRDGVCAQNAEAVGVAATDEVVVCGARRNYPGAGAVTAVHVQGGEPAWKLKLPTVDSVAAAGSTVVASYGDRAAVIDAASGRLIYETEADDGHAPRTLPLTFDEGEGGSRVTRVVSVERGGAIVGRDPRAGGAAVWAVGVSGYVRALHRAGDRVAVSLASGELVLVSVRDGATSAVGGWAASWRVPGGGELMFDDSSSSPASGVSLLRAYGLDGLERFDAAYAIAAPLELSSLRAAGTESPVLLVSHRGEARVLVVEPRRGALVAVHILPSRWVHGSVFGASVDGRPVAGVVLQKPLAAHIF